MRKILFLSSVAFLITSCTSTGPATSGSKIAAPPASAKVTLLFQSSRQGWLEPCGCTSKPWGGLDREFNAVTEARAKGPVIYVDAGNSLAPLKSKSKPDAQKEKSKALYGMLEQVGMDVQAVGPTEAGLGVEFLKSISGGKVKLVSANLVGTDGNPVVAPYAVVEKGGVSYGFISVMPGNTAVSDAKVNDPKDALKKYLPELKEKSHFVVLLSQLGSTEDEKIAKEFPDVQIIVGADNEFSFDEPLWYNAGKTLHVDPLHLGYLLGKIELDLLFPFQGFYSTTVVTKNQAEKAKLEKQLAKKPADEAAKKKLERLKATSNLEIIPSGSTFKHDLIKLRKETYGKPNDLSKSIKAEKERVRKSAIKNG